MCASTKLALIYLVERRADEEVGNRLFHSNNAIHSLNACNSAHDENACCVFVGRRLVGRDAVPLFLTGNRRQ